MHAKGKLELCQEFSGNKLILLQKLSVINKLGADCHKHQCDIPHSGCDINSFKCICDKGYIESSDEIRCIIASVHLSQPCEMNEQCVKYDMNSVCSDGRCACLKNFTLHDSSCRSLVKLEEHCESSEECHKFTTNVTCLNHKCTCDKDFVSSSNGNVRKIYIITFRYY